MPDNGGSWSGWSQSPSGLPCSSSSRRGRPAAARSENGDTTSARAFAIQVAVPGQAGGSAAVVHGAARRGRRRRLVRLPRGRHGRQCGLGDLGRLRDARLVGDGERLRSGLDDLDLRRRRHRQQRHREVQGLGQLRASSAPTRPGSLSPGLVVQGAGGHAGRWGPSSRSATGATS